MSASAKLCLLMFGSAGLAACGGGGNGAPAPAPPMGLSTGPAVCAAGRAADFACAGIALRSRVPLAEMGATRGNDVWGWFDSVERREYALVGLANGMAIVDVTDPELPVRRGILPTRTTASVWRDIKVYRDHAYVVADNVGSHGMQVLDLTVLRTGPTAPQTFAATVVYGDFGSAHNLALDEDTGYAYAVGSDTCDGGLHMIDLATPNNPLFAGCHSFADTHDTQCVVYAGPDPDYAGREICVSSNGDHVEIVDVTDKFSPVTVATTDYPDVGFTHQGWLTEDHRWFLLGDEGDELGLLVNTRTHVFDLEDLDAPLHAFVYTHSTIATDHNLYVLGDLVFEANYSAGLRVLELVSLGGNDIDERAWFDTYPQGDARGFDGAWSVYPFLPSGNVLVSDVVNGLFVLTLE